MKKFKKDWRGAITVIVTLFLLPAVLVSGTAVDTARISTARSIVQNANQVALNSVLTQYDALLKDLYGLFGVAKDDPILVDLVNEYINVVLFSDETTPVKINTLSTFYGTDKNNVTATVSKSKSLGEAEVIRNQIEEYMKIRGPIIIVQNILDALSGSNTINKDAKVIEDKLSIDKDISNLFELYKRLYNAINTADNCRTAVGGGGYLGSVSSSLDNIRQQFVDLKICYENWEKSDDEDDKRKYAEQYNGILDRIKLLTSGGPRNYSTWKYGSYNNNNPPEWESGYWRTRNTAVDGLNTNIANAIQQAEDFKPHFDSVLSIAREIDNKHNELISKIEELERKLNNGECSEELKNSMTQLDNEGKSLMDRYREIVQWDIAPMAELYKNDGYGYIDTVKDMLQNVKYRDSSYSESLTRADLANLSNLANPNFELREDVSYNNSKAAYFSDFSNVTYNMPLGFNKFVEYSYSNDRSRNFYEELKKMMETTGTELVEIDGKNDAEGDDSEEKQKNIINNVITLAKNTYYALANSPQGADYITDSMGYEPTELNFLEAVDMIAEAMGDNIINTFTDPVGQIKRTADYMLILTYGTSMFSNYTTTKPGSIGKPAEQIDYEKSITGALISPEVNYFYQSEWEYLLGGNQDVKQNLWEVTRLILTIRIVCNYITVFNVSEITVVVNGIRAAFVWAPPIGITLGELARAAFVIVESVIDVADLRSGHSVPFIKKSNEWMCGVSGISDLMTRVARVDDTAEMKINKANGITYSNYLMCFFIGKTTLGLEYASNELVERIAQLIEWNVINYKNDIGQKTKNERPAVMNMAVNASNRFKMSDMYTNFSISTKLNLKMLFLSMPFAYSEWGFINPPGEFEMEVMNHRGY